MDFVFLFINNSYLLLDKWCCDVVPLYLYLQILNYSTNNQKKLPRGK